MDLDKIPLHEQAGETRPSTSAKRVEKKEALDDFRKMDILVSNSRTWRPEQASASFLILSRTRSTTSCVGSLIPTF